MRKITIAIDGHSSTGKSTIARQLARKLSYIYIDTGAMYRAVAFFSLENSLIGDKNGIIGSLSHMQLEFKRNNTTGNVEMYLNKRNVEKEIRSLEVSGQVSKIAAIPKVRQKLVAMQRHLGKDKGVVMDGRDIGTVVFPDAELKFFITAAPAIRAQRRYEELLGKGEEINYKDVLKNIRERDYIDSNREDSPLKKAPDAIHIDNSDVTPEEQFELIYSHVSRVITT